MRRLLITGAGGPAGIALGAQLAAGAGDLDLEWIGVDIVGLDDPNFPVTSLVPRADDPDYPHGMHEAIARYRPDLLIPTVSDELPQLAVLAEALGLRAPGLTDGPSIMISAAGPSAIAADKLLTMWVLERARVPIPRFAATTDFADTASAIAWGEGPVVVKPRISRGGRGVVLVEKPGDLDWTQTGPAQIVQTFAGGDEYSPQLYRSPLTGECTVVVLHKTELKEGRVGNALTTQRVDGDAVADVVATAIATAQALDLVGPVDMDIRRDADGTPVVLEVNSRFGANSQNAPELLAAVLAEWLA
ncbi:MAG: ATP-grasp domain-containing protein [Propionicimonas sp.]|uniref:ATP-grasp domain-containing protein n=1 Tax=Propionicimonas sp. TaxID=1955623 RepID=UPI003D13152A